MTTTDQTGEPERFIPIGDPTHDARIARTLAETAARFTTQPPPLADHTKIAADWLLLVDDQYELDRISHEAVASYLARAQVHATLALAAELRTTALIARWDALRNPPVGIRTTVDHWNEIERLDREIRARLTPETPEDAR